MSAACRQRERCALCQAPREALPAVMSLAPTPPANELVRAEEVGRPQEAFPLTLLLCAGCGHLQLAEIVDPQRLFGNYVYVSGTSRVFVEHFRRYAGAMAARFELSPASSIVEIGSNDGTLLKQFQALGLTRVLGVDPAAAIARQAEAAGVPTLAEFFHPALAASLRRSRGPADLVVANNVFAHAEDLRGLAGAVRDLLADEGVFVFEVSYLLDVTEKLLFDTIYHEHLAYHAVAPLVPFFAALGLRLFDVERVDTHGGSLRGFACRAGARHRSSPRVQELCAEERAAGLFAPEFYRGWKARIGQRGEELRGALQAIQARGERVAGFGAPAKLTTLMHEFGLGRSQLDFIVDDSSWKQGLFTPGTHIPILASAELTRRQPAWCVVFAWNFADSIVANNQAYRAAGGRFIVPLPELRTV